MDAIKLLKLGWKAGATVFTVASIAVAGLFLTLNSASAGAPNLTVLYLGNNNNDPGDSWDHDVTLNPGQMVQLYAEIHNTNVPSTAENVKIKVTLPSGSGTSTATVSADNASSVSDNVNLTVNGGGQLQYVAGSTLMTWDQNGDGNYEYNGTVMPDGIVSGNGLTVGNQNGCNQYIIQISFLVEVVAPEASPSPSPSPSPTPSPTPTVVPSPSPSPAIGGNIVNNNTNVNNNNVEVKVENKQENKQEQNQTVNVTGSVAGAKVPLKQPETGVGVLGMAAMFSAAPLGLVLSRYGRGRMISTKKDEELSEIANGLVNERRGKRA